MAAENSSEEDPTKLCDSCCFRGVEKQAVVKCDECVENLCSSCEEIHRSFKATRGHVLTPLSDATVIKHKPLPVFMFCVEHPAELLSMICLSHNQVCCKLCKPTKHRKCEVKTTREQASEDKAYDQTKGFYDKVQEVLSQFEKIKDIRENDKNEIENCSRSVRQHLEQIKVEILAWLERLENKVEDELAAKEKKLAEMIGNHIETAEQMIVQLREIVNSFESLEEYDQVGKFTLMMKNEDQLKHGDVITEELTKEIRPVKFHFEVSDKIKNLASSVSDFGKIQDDLNFDFLEISTVTRINNIPTFTECISGCAFMPDGKLVICHGLYSGIMKLLTSDFQVRDELVLKHGIWDVASIGPDDIVVTGKDSKQLHFFDIESGIIKKKSITINIDCYGIDYKNEKLYVSSWEKEIQILTLDGTKIHTFTIDQGIPIYLAANNAGNSILFGTSSSSVVATDEIGKCLFNYAEKQLQCALGLVFDNKDNFLVCCLESNSIYVVKRNGSKHRILLTNAEGVNEPYCLAYRPTDRTLIVGQNKEPRLLVFTVSFRSWRCS